MGCICCKPSTIEDIPPLPQAEVGLPAKLSEKHGKLNGQDLAAERRREKQLQQAAAAYVIRPAGGVPKGLEGEQVAAGWPSWLAAVAGEAIRGWVPHRADSFEKLDKIGQGTYSNVYRARDLDNGKIFALKKVRFDNLEPESVRFMSREIHILRRLDHPNIVKLKGLVTSRMSCSLYLIFEYMEHDLAGLASAIKFTESQIKCYMQQLLRGLDHCHSRGILHRDIKGSNLLVDNTGVLKIADFGLASFFDPEQQHPLTSRVVTLWYRPPELLLGATNYSVSVDLWSTGCILAELYARKPIMPGRTEVEQLHKIFKLCGSPSEEYWRKAILPHATIFKPQQPYRRCVQETFKDFPPPALTLVEVLLAIDPAGRGTAASALKSEFFIAKPLACDPSSLPKYPPSKELDAKVRDEEARRRGGSGSKVRRADLEKKGVRESKAVPAPDANAELSQSLMKRQFQPVKSRSEKFNLHHEEVASGFRMEPPIQVPVLDGSEDARGHFPKKASHSGPLVNRSQWTKSRKNECETPKSSFLADYSSLSGIGIRKNNVPVEGSEKVDSHAGALAPSGRHSEAGVESSDVTRNDEQMYHTCRLSESHRKDNENIANMDHIVQQKFGSKGHNIHYSGPLPRMSANVDQILKDHDRHIQEAFRRARHDKSKARRAQAEGTLAGIRPFKRGASPVYPPSRGSFPIFSSSRMH